MEKPELKPLLNSLGDLRLAALQSQHQNFQIPDLAESQRFNDTDGGVRRCRNPLTLNVAVLGSRGEPPSKTSRGDNPVRAAVP